MSVSELDNSVPDRRPIWSDEETKYFLGLLIDFQLTQHIKINGLRKASVFQAVENPMRCAGYNRTFYQLRIKWKNMKKSYVDARRAMAAGGSPYTVCPFYDELQPLLKDYPSRSRSRSGGEARQTFEAIDITSNDCRENFEDAHIDADMKLFSQFAESTNAVIVKKECRGEEGQSCADADTSHARAEPFHELNALQNSDPDHLFLAMILPDLKKLSYPKKRRVKMDIQKLLDEALTEEDQ